ncbi:MAG: hypothetical protein COC01_07980 [Bacteroidetes bacterium]|nr:MAG: hypothetical protein COC01_07980 [Bacteroidota bacterium]
MQNIWIKSIVAFLILFPISIFFHEVGHWIIYEINGVDSWISLQRAIVVNPDQLTEDIFLKSLFGGPILTILLALAALFLLKNFPNSIWILVFGLINSTFRILPTLIGTFTAFKTDLHGISDEGNIVLRILDNALLREMMLILLLVFYVFIIIRIYKTFKFPGNFRQKKPLFFTICFLTILISLTYPKLDQLLFGV